MGVTGIRVNSKLSNGHMIIGFCLELIIIERILRNNWKIWILILILPLIQKRLDKLPNNSLQSNFFCVQIEGIL